MVCVCACVCVFGGGGGGGWGVEGRGGRHFYHSCLYIKIQKQYTLEQYYYTALYRQQIPTVWFGRE